MLGFTFFRPLRDALNLVPRVTAASGDVLLSHALEGDVAGPAVAAAGALGRVAGSLTTAVRLRAVALLRATASSRAAKGKTLAVIVLQLCNGNQTNRSAGLRTEVVSRSMYSAAPHAPNHKSPVRRRTVTALVTVMRLTHKHTKRYLRSG